MHFWALCYIGYVKTAIKVKTDPNKQKVQFCSPKKRIDTKEIFHEIKSLISRQDNELPSNQTSLLPLRQAVNIIAKICDIALCEIQFLNLFYSPARYTVKFQELFYSKV